MPRVDLRPLAAAAATAIVSCGLLAFAVGLGLLGANVGRGANFCEAARDAIIVQPANTFSNAGFVVAGLAIAWHTGSGMARGSVLAANRGFATGFACLVVLLGPASAAMHATQSAAGGHLDLASMYLVASFVAAYAGMRWFKGGPAQFVALFVGGVAFCEIVGLLGTEVPVVQYAGNLAFALLLIIAVALEVGLLRRAGCRAHPWYGIAALATIVVAFVIWNVSTTRLCSPDSLLQGHAIWHLLCAVAAYLLYRFYASEDASAG